MAEIHDEPVLTPDERRFREYLMRGDDFCKIEIYRQAVGWYRKAVDLKPDDPEARQRLRECSAKIRAESKAILIILAVAVVVIVIAVIFS